MIRKLLIIGVLVFVLIAFFSDRSTSVPISLDGEDSVTTDVSEDLSTDTTPSASETKINVPGWVDSPYVTPDGSALYFMYSRYNFFPIFTGGTPRLVTKSREGHHSNDNPWEDSDVYVSYRQSDGSWGVPQNLSFNTIGSECCAMVVGSPAVMYYQTGFADTSQDIVYRVQNPNGSWGKVVRLPQGVNSVAVEDNPHVSADQNHLWFTSQSREGGVGGYDIWYSKRVDGEWSEAVNVGAPLNTAGDEDQIWVGEDGTTYFNRSDGVYESHWDGSRFSDPTKVVIDAPVDHVAEVSLTRDGVMYFAGADPGAQEIKLYSATQQRNGVWGPARLID